MNNQLINNIWQMEYFENTILDYTIFLALSFVLILSFFCLKLYILKRGRRYIETRGLSGFFLRVLDRTRLPFYTYVSLYVFHFMLVVPDLITQILTYILIIWIGYRVIASGSQAIDFAIEGYKEKEEKQASKGAMRVLGQIAKAFLWIFVLLVLLSVFGINVTGLVAGLGIGGIAIAFALQNILSDLFSSFSIYFDKPFVEGDFIIVGDKTGIVERIGIKSTRVRALQGEEIVFSNQELTSAQIHNYKGIERRRADLNFGVVYNTPAENLEKIPEIVKKVVEEQELTEFDRAHFRSFGDFSLDFAVVYYVNSSDFKSFMDTYERVLLGVKREFEKENIEFAYPTKTIYLAKDNK